jgi:putative Mn2+ efflux pump MntP
MISFEVFLMGLMVVSTLTGLVVEAVKKILVEYSVKYRANTLAGIVAAVLSVAIGVGYAIVTQTSFTAQFIVCLIALVFMSWLCSMVGYDKVIGVFKSANKDK